MRVKRVNDGPPVHTVKVKLLKGVILGPGEDGAPGDIYELPRYKATELISHGQAVQTYEGDPLVHNEVIAEAKDPDAVRTVTLEAPTARDPRPAKRGKSGKSEE
jgi:hypothetical protein